MTDHLTDSTVWLDGPYAGQVLTDAEIEAHLTEWRPLGSGTEPNYSAIRDAVYEGDDDA